MNAQISKHIKNVKIFLLKCFIKEKYLFRYYLSTSKKECKPFRTCKQIKVDTNHDLNGSYWLHGENKSEILVYCDMKNKGWTLMMHRTEFNNSFPFGNIKK